MHLRIEARFHFKLEAEQTAAPRRIDRLHFAHAIQRLRRLDRSNTKCSEISRRNRSTDPIARRIISRDDRETPEFGGVCTFPRARSSTETTTFTIR
jgi:hypothetical protein